MSLVAAGSNRCIHQNFIRSRSVGFEKEFKGQPRVKANVLCVIEIGRQRLSAGCNTCLISSIATQLHAVHAKK